jgi:hypothetical protein
MRRRRFLASTATLAAASVAGCAGDTSGRSFEFSSWEGRRWLRYESAQSGEYARLYPQNDWWMLATWTVTAGEERLSAAEACDVVVVTDRLVHAPTTTPEDVDVRGGDSRAWNSLPPSSPVPAGEGRTFTAVFDVAADFDPRLRWTALDVGDKPPVEENPPPYEGSR